jgi:hypothetical protein
MPSEAYQDAGFHGVRPFNPKFPEGRDAIFAAAEV